MTPEPQLGVTVQVKVTTMSTFVSYGRVVESVYSETLYSWLTES
jgi:hypothetical protein